MKTGGSVLVMMGMVVCIAGCFCMMDEVLNACMMRVLRTVRITNYFMFIRSMASVFLLSRIANLCQNPISKTSWPWDSSQLVMTGKLISSA